MRITPLVNGIIVAPHGITDLFHAYSYDNMHNLMKIYGGSLIFMKISNLIHSNFQDVNLLDNVFYASSIFHFKHDMPKLKNNDKVIPYLLSSILVTSTLVMDMDLFTVYMTLIHVPRHYLKCWDFMKKYKELLLLSIIVLSVPGYLIIDNLNNLDKDILSIVESIVIAHIIYNEKYIDNNEKNSDTNSEDVYIIFKNMLPIQEKK